MFVYKLAKYEKKGNFHKKKEHFHFITYNK